MLADACIEWIISVLSRNCISYFYHLLVSCSEIDLKKLNGEGVVVVDAFSCTYVLHMWVGLSKSDQVLVVMKKI